jgi:hypothetical protein
MTLRTYHQPVLTYQVTPEELEWVEWFASSAIAKAVSEGKEIQFPRKKARYIKAHKLCCLGFAKLFGLDDQWKRHERISMWPPDTDFSGHGHKLRIVGVPLDEKYNFGSRTRGRVWDNDFNSGLTGFVLAGWFPPYVDVIGWLPHDDLRLFRSKSWYELSEPVCRAISTLTGFRSVT